MVWRWWCKDDDDYEVSDVDDYEVSDVDDDDSGDNIFVSDCLVMIMI